MRVLSDLIQELGLPVEARPLALRFVKQCEHPYCQRNATMSIVFEVGNGESVRYLCLPCGELLVDLVTGEPDKSGWLRCR